MKEGNRHSQACSTKPGLACHIDWSICFNVLIISLSCNKVIYLSIKLQSSKFRR